MPRRIETYQQAFELIGVTPNDKLREIFKRLISGGRTEKSICYAMWKSHEKLIQYKNDNRFYSILENEIKKWSWGADDPRWESYRERKKQEKEAELITKHECKIQSIQKGDKEGKKDSGGYIYFIQGQCGGAIKIGYAKNVAERLKGLQTGFPDILVVLYAIPGNYKTEKKYHEKFIHLHLRGEWYKPDVELLEEINILRKKYLTETR